MKMLTSLRLTILILAHTAIGFADTRLELLSDDVVVFAGGTNALHLQQAGYLEAMLTHRFRDHRLRFRDLSWEGDTVFRQGSVVERWRTDGFGPREQQLRRVGATVVFAQFGQLESLNGAQHIQSFVAGYEKLLAVFRSQARLVVVVSPTAFEKPNSTGSPDLSQRNADLRLYVSAIRELAHKHRLPFVDLFHNLQTPLTENGMHVTPKSQKYLAQEIAKQLGTEIDPRFDLEPLRGAVIEKHRLWYDYWRPANWKLLYGDDARRVFTRGGRDHVPFKEEWKRLLPLVAAAEQRIWTIARGGQDPGHNRPRPEILHGDPTADISAELKSFATSHGLQVNLFASEREGLTSPLAIRWDPAGRMYVSVTTTYPHVIPGDLPNDKIIRLEDTDRDGVADVSTVFADQLNIPTGFELGDGGVYVGQNTELLFLRDENGDGSADKRRVLLSGFGNGDSHQTINSFIWSPGGELFFGQGDGIESRVETPWGLSQLFQAGFHRLRPHRLQLDPLLDDFMGPGNPWGVAFDDWGQIFSIDGAGGVTFLTPGQIPTHHRRRLKTIGEPGGYCGIGYLDGRHLPGDLRGDFAIGDFKRNRIKRFSVTRRGAGFALEWKEPLLTSAHRNFRPVDVKMGPDGAIYVVDWYNPVTCHQDDAYRDPTRDKAHGRIWRLTSDREFITQPSLARASLFQVLDALKAPEHWTRYQAKRELSGRDATNVVAALHQWVRNLNPKESEYEHYLYEALGVYATLETVAPSLLQRLLHARDPRARAYAARIVGRWHDRLGAPLDMLAPRVTDHDPLVRMEAVMACAAVGTSDAIEVAAHVLDMPSDPWIEYSWKQTIQQLRPYWMAALREGKLDLEPHYLAALLDEVGDEEALDDLKRLVNSEKLSPVAKVSLVGAILTVGDASDLKNYGLSSNIFRQSGKYDASAHADVLERLIETTRFRKLRPSGDVDAEISGLLEHNHERLHCAAMTLAGIWKVKSVHQRIVSTARNKSLTTQVRAAALGALADMQMPAGHSLIRQCAGDQSETKLQVDAIQVLARFDVDQSARHAVSVFRKRDLDAVDCPAIIRAVLAQRRGATALVEALQDESLAPSRAAHVLRSLLVSGRADKPLFDLLNDALGADTNIPPYSAQYVAGLVDDAKARGQANRGATIYRAAACGACHRISGSGGKIGPDLTAIGTTLSPDRIVEELLWPNRHVKEGYSVLQVVTDEGKVHVGYQRTTRDSQQTGDLILEDLATRKRITIPRKSIEAQRVTGSPMPTGLTSRLTRGQLVDLIQYVTELGRIR